MKIAIRLDGLQQPVRRAIETAARLRAQGVVAVASGDLAPQALSETARHELRRLVEGRGLSWAAFVFASRRALLDPIGFDERMQRLRETLTFSYQCHGPTVCCYLGTTGVAEDDPRRPMLVQVLTDVGQFAAHVGATLALRSGGESPRDLAALLGTDTTGAVGISYDPVAVLGAGFDPAETGQALGHWIAHVHARDATRAGVHALEEVPLGQGDVAWPDLLGALEEFDYHGYFTVERASGNEPVAEAARAVQFLSALRMG